ncbi:MAG: hypothetical protein LBJ23_04430 [Tannerella sp.]|nr:hypothetical protein [Tannerella sp.]
MKPKTFFRLMLAMFALCGLNINVHGADHRTPAGGFFRYMDICTEVTINGVVQNSADLEIAAFNAGNMTTGTMHDKRGYCHYK